MTTKAERLIRAIDGEEVMRCRDLRNTLDGKFNNRDEMFAWLQKRERDLRRSGQKFAKLHRAHRVLKSVKGVRRNESVARMTLPASSKKHAPKKTGAEAGRSRKAHRERRHTSLDALFASMRELEEFRQKNKHQCRNSKKSACSVEKPKARAKTRGH